MSGFLLKRMLGDLLAPLSVAFLLVIAGLVVLWLGRKTAGKALVGLGALLIFALSYGLVTDRMLERLEYQYPALADAGPHRGIRWVVVLGGGLVTDPRLPLTGQLTQGSQIRVVEGVRLCRQLRGAKLLVSGGPVFNDVPESRAMAALAVALGVPAGDIVQDSLSLDTEQQVGRVHALAGGDSLILVTSAYHMPRSMALFGSVGLACVPAPTDHLVKRQRMFSPERLFPNSGAIRRAETAVHEYIGIIWSGLRKKS